MYRILLHDPPILIFCWLMSSELYRTGWIMHSHNNYAFTGPTIPMSHGWNGGLLSLNCSLPYFCSLLSFLLHLYCVSVPYYFLWLLSIIIQFSCLQFSVTPMPPALYFASASLLCPSFHFSLSYSQFNDGLTFFNKKVVASLIQLSTA